MKVESTKKLGKIDYDPETGLYCAEVLYISAMETFQTQDIGELRHLLQHTLDEPLEIRPSTSLLSDPSGETILLCLEPALYLRLNRQAGRANKNLNEYIVDILQEAVDHSRFLEPA